jgi:site-specific DNA-adenine methylase
MVYQGSKTKYAKYIIPILQRIIEENNINTFIDGMCGGCNIVDKIVCTNKIALDINPYLIELYKYIQKDNYTFPEVITREMWDSCKNTPEKNKPWLVALVAYFGSYSARGFNGGFALNGERNYYNERLKNFKKQIPLLQDIKFYCSDINKVDYKDCLIYLDPPYQRTKGYDYNKNFNYETFWNTVRRLSKNNIVIVSEQNAPSDFKNIWNLNINRNCFGSKLKEASENLFVLNSKLV